MAEEEQKRDYTAIHLEFIALMAANGMKIEKRRRLPIFQLFHRLGKITEPPDAAEVAARLRFLLCEMVDLRKAGREPPHKNGMYT